MLRGSSRGLRLRPLYLWIVPLAGRLLAPSLARRCLVHRRGGAASKLALAVALGFATLAPPPADALPGDIDTVAGTGKRGKLDGPGQQATFGAPKHICVDDADNVYIADEANDLIRKYDPRTGRVSTILGQGKVKLDFPHGVTWEKGKLYVVDTGHNRILRIED